MKKIPSFIFAILFWVAMFVLVSEKAAYASATAFFAWKAVAFIVWVISICVLTKRINNNGNKTF